MTVQRGEIWWAELDPIRGSEQAGIRPVLIFQNDTISMFTTTILAIPLTTNLRHALLPSCVLPLASLFHRGKAAFQVLRWRSVTKCAYWIRYDCEAK